MDELVSIVVPVYNTGRRLIKCIGSLINQTYKSIEIILVDDGSTDDSLDVCHNLASEDNRIVVIHTSNQGSGPARNAGIEAAAGRYVYFPDADDLVAQNAIEILVNAMINECDLVVFGFSNISFDGKKVMREKRYVDSIQDADSIRNDYYNYLGSEREYSIQGAPWNKFFSLSIIKDNNVRFPPLRRHQDEAFIGRYMCYSKRVHFIEDVLYNYYTNDLKLEWQKYPKDYIDSVTGLYQIRKETILTWNSEDKKTHESITCEFICKAIKAFELSYSPKMGLNMRSRRIWLAHQIDSIGILDIKAPDSLGEYQKIIINLIHKRRIRLLLFIFWMKVLAEKSLVKSTIKR